VTGAELIERLVGIPVVPAPVYVWLYRAELALPSNVAVVVEVAGVLSATTSWLKLAVVSAIGCAVNCPWSCAVSTNGMKSRMMCFEENMRKNVNWLIRKILS
jgi:hypothetical protein